MVIEIHNQLWEESCWIRSCPKIPPTPTPTLPHSTVANMGNNASRSQTPDPEQQPPCWEDSFPSQTSRSTYYNIPYQLQSEEYSFHAQTLSTYHALFGPSQQSHSYKRAVLCGLLHKGTKHELDGCINDVKIMKYILVVRFKFPESSIITLTGTS